MVSEPTRQKRRSMPAETRLLSEWLAENYFGSEIRYHFRVGSTPRTPGVVLLDEAERNMARVANRWVDAIVVAPPRLIVIEATMYRAVDKVSQLQGYLLLLKSTPEWAQWAGLRVHPLLLTGQHDVVAEHLCKAGGIEYVVWEPPWMDEFLAAYGDRRRRSPHAGAIAEITTSLQ